MDRNMKKTSPWFILLFPIAIPAMIVLDYFGYRIIALIILVALVLSFAYYVYSLFAKFRSLRDEFVSLAEDIVRPRELVCPALPLPPHTLRLRCRPPVAFLPSRAR